MHMKKMKDPREDQPQIIAEQSATPRLEQDRPKNTNDKNKVMINMKELQIEQHNKCECKYI